MGSDFWHDKQKEFHSTWHDCIRMYDGVEKWQRHQAYTDARENGMGQDEAWAKMLTMKKEELPHITFVWDGVTRDAGKYQQ